MTGKIKEKEMFGLPLQMIIMILIGLFAPIVIALLT